MAESGECRQRIDKASSRRAPRMPPTDCRGIRGAVGGRRRKHARDAIGNRSDIVRINEAGSEVPEHLDQCRVRRHDNGCAAAQSLERRQSETLGQ